MVGDTLKQDAINVKNFGFFFVFSLTFSSHVFSSEKDIYEFSWLDPDKEVFVDKIGNIECAIVLI